MKRLVFLACGLVACSATDPRPPSVHVPADAAMPHAPDAAPLSSPTEPLVGAYHEAGEGDALNLVIDADGTWRWTINGCDFKGSACGTWAKNGDRLELSAPDAGKNAWINDVGLVDILGTLGATAQGDEMVITGRVDAGEVRGLEQRWQRGAVCPVCEEGGGPRALEPCDKAPPKAVCSDR
jgi:hypothetical protein